MLHVKLKVSTYAHARIKKVDTSKAEKVTEVHAIIVGDSLPLTGTDINDRPIFSL